MADSASIITNVIDGTTIGTNLTNGVSITSSLVEGTSISSNLVTGAKGDTGQGVPTGGTAGQILAKIDATNYNTQWVAPAAGTVTSVAGKTGVITLAESDITNLPADLAAKQATLVSSTNIKTINGNSLLGSGDLTIAGGTSSDATPTAKGIVQLAGDLAGTAAAPTVPGLAGKEPTITAGTSAQYYRGDKTMQTLNQDAVPSGTTNKAYTATEQTKLAAISGTNTGDETTATIKTKLGITTLSGSNTGDQDLSSYATTASVTSGLAGKQATFVSGTNLKTVGGVSLLGSGDVPITGGSGTVTSVSVTTANGVSGTVATATTTPAISLTLGAITPTSVASTGAVTGSNLTGTNTGDQVIPTTLPPNGAATGDLSGSYPSPNVAKINGTALSGLATGILKNTTATGVPSIAAPGTDYVVPSGSITGSAATLTTARTIGTLTGDVTSTGSTFNGSANNTNATTVTKINGTSLAALGTGILKNTTTTGVPSIAVASDFPTLNQNTTGTAASITGSITESQVTNLPTDLAAKQATLVSGTNIKTINSTSLLGSGDIVISGGASAATFTTAGTVKQTQYNVRDYGAVGDGTTDDTTAIQSALTAAATAGGGVVYVPRATYIVSNLTIGSYVELLGAGRGTMLQAKAGSTGYMIALTTPASTQQIAVRDITLRPNTGTMGGVYLDNTGFTSAIDPLHVLEDIVVLDAGGDGFRFNTNQRELKVIGCYVHNAQGYGYYLAAGCTDSRFINNTVGPSTLHGFYISGNNNSFVNCKAFWNGYNGSTWNATSNGFHVVSAAYNMFSACSAQQSALHGFHFAGNARTTVTGCDADTNSAGTTTGVGFNTDSNTYCTFSANTGGNNGILTPGNQLYGLQVANVQTGTLFIGNTVNGTSGDFGYVSGYGYMLISGSIADFTGITTKLNSVSQFGLLGSTSGTTTVVPAAIASGTLTLPAATDTLVGQSTADTLTNKTISAPTLSGTLTGTYTLGGTPTFPSTVVSTTGTQTLTNKRITQRAGSATTSATPSINTDTFDSYNLTAQAGAITSFTLSGTPTDHQELLIRIKATGAFAITAPTNVQNSGIATFPTTTVSGKTITAGLRYDAVATKWIVLAVDATGY